MKILTKDLKKALSAINYVITEDGLRPITGIIELVAEDETLTINSTDYNGFISVTAPLQEPSDFKTVIKKDKLTSLTNATTKPVIELVQKDNEIIMKGNGRYKLPIISEDGINPVKYPQLSFVVDDLEPIEVSRDDIYKLEKNNSICVNFVAEREVLYNYYQTEDKIITGDGAIVTFSNINVFNPNETITPKLLKFLSIEPFANVYTTTNHYYVQGKEYKAKLFRYNTNFPIEVVEPVTKVEFDGKIVLSTTDIKNVVKRLGIFKEGNEVEPVTIRFGNNITFKYLDVEETISQECGHNYSIRMSLKALEDIMKVLTTEEVTFYYGLPNCVKFEVPEVSIISGLLGV